MTAYSRRTLGKALRTVATHLAQGDLTGGQAAAVLVTVVAGRGGRSVLIRDMERLGWVALADPDTRRYVTKRGRLTITDEGRAALAAAGWKP